MSISTYRRHGRCCTAWRPSQTAGGHHVGRSGSSSAAVIEFVQFDAGDIHIDAKYHAPQVTYKLLVSENSEKSLRMEAVCPKSGIYKMYWYLPKI